VAGKVRGKEIKDPDFPDAVRKRTTVDLDATKRDKATTEGVFVVRGSSQAKEWVEFRAFTPREFFDLFLKKGDNIQFTSEDHLDLACFLMEAGLGDVAVLEKNVAIMGANPVAIDPALEAWFKAEIASYFNWNGPGGVVPLFERYRRDRLAGAKKEVLEGMRREIEEKIKELLNTEAYWITDFSILNLSQGGPEGPHPDRVLPAAVVEEFLLTLGVEGGKRLPPASLPPSNGGGVKDPTSPPVPGGGPTGGEEPGKREDPPPPPPPPPSKPDNPK